MIQAWKKFLIISQYFRDIRNKDAFGGNTIIVSYFFTGYKNDKQGS